MRRKKAIVQLVGIILVAVVSLLWTFKVDNKPLLGLDLQGGVSVILSPETPAGDDEMNQAIAIMNNRINALGVSEPDIHRQGNNIVVQIAGIQDQDKAIDLVKNTAQLQFRPVLQQGLAQPPETTPETTPPGSTPGTAPEVTPGSAPVTDAGAPPADASTVPTTTPVTTAPVTTEVGAPMVGVATPKPTAADGEVAAGGAREQTPSTVAEQPVSTVTPTESTPPVTDPTTGQPVASTPPVTDPTTGQPIPSDPTQSSLPIDPTASVPGAPTAAPNTATFPGAKGNEETAPYTYTVGEPIVSGQALDTATAGLDQTGQWIVNPKFKPGAEGIDQFNAIAAKCFAKDPSVCPSGKMAIVLDDEVISALGFQTGSFSADQIQVSGGFTEESARSLATSLKYGALPVALKQESSQQVSATLGRDALNAGIIAGFVGLALVAVYMIAFYRLLGLLAILKLGLEAALLWSLISFLGTTAGLALTLAGVTGIIVSIGVSLDSNVVYYEHLREDIRNGRTIRSAVDRSFDTAIGTILKADGASLLGAGLLYWLAVGPVRGFAFYLAISTALDLISSYLYMRPVVFLSTASKMCRNHPAWFGLPADAAHGDPTVRERAGRKPASGAGDKEQTKRGKRTATDDDGGADADVDHGVEQTETDAKSGATS